MSCGLTIILRLGNAGTAILFKGMLTNTSSANRLILVNASSKDGFLLVSRFNLRSQKGFIAKDYGIKFEKWVCEKLLPNLSYHIVIVLDNAPCRRLQNKNLPTEFALNIGCLLETRQFYCTFFANEKVPSLLTAVRTILTQKRVTWSIPCRNKNKISLRLS